MRRVLLPRHLSRKTDRKAEPEVCQMKTAEGRGLQIEALGKLPEGEIAVKVKGNPPANEAMMRTEAPRGELFYYAKGNGTRNLERLKIRTPTFTNLPSVLVLLPGCQLADVPVNVLSIDPCVSCTER